MKSVKEPLSRCANGKKAVAQLVSLVREFVTDKWAGDYVTDSYGDPIPTDEFEKIFENMTQLIKEINPNPSTKENEP